MARLQILELPTEHHGDDMVTPFVLVIDQVPSDETKFDAIRRDLLADGDLAPRLGARAVLVFEETVEIPANEVGANPEPLLRVGDPTTADDAERAGITQIVYAHERTRLDLCSALLLDSGTTWRRLVELAAERQRELADAYRKLDSTKAEPEGDLNCRDEVTDTRDAADFYGPKLRHLGRLLDEARVWARHGYEIGQKHCGWTDHGVAPAWLTEGWPNSFDSCEHLKRAAEMDGQLSRVRKAIEERRTEVAEFEAENKPSSWSDAVTVTCDRIADALRVFPPSVPVQEPARETETP